MSPTSNHAPLIGVSMFASAGIAEQYLEETNINIVAANELLPERARLYQAQYPNSKMICGDIMNQNIFDSLVSSTPENIDFLLASPPCQGMSVAGKNRSISQMLTDERNFLVFKAIEFIELKHPNYVLIENVPAFLKLELPFQGKLQKITDILTIIFGEDYIINPHVFDAAEYGVAQHRDRAIIKLYKKGLEWGMPETQPYITVKDAIGNLPSLEAGESSTIKWHFARQHSSMHINCMRHTPTGESAIDNPVYYPQKENGERVKAYRTTFRRMKWNSPAPTITMRNDAISSQQNVHPGRPLADGTYSDARVLTPLELMLLSSLPADWNIPTDTPELLIRKCIGECIPPLLIKKIVTQIK